MSLTCTSPYWLLYQHHTILSTLEIQNQPPEEIHKLKCIAALVLSHLSTKNIFVHSDNTRIAEYLSLLIPDAKIYTSISEDDKIEFDACIGKLFNTGYNINVRDGAVLILDGFNLITYLKQTTYKLENFVNIENTELIYSTVKKEPSNG